MNGNRDNGWIMYTDDGILCSEVPYTNPATMVDGDYQAFLQMLHQFLDGDSEARPNGGDLSTVSNNLSMENRSRGFSCEDFSIVSKSLSMENGNGGFSVQKLVVRDDQCVVDPCYEIFLENVRKDGDSYGFEVKKKDGKADFMKYEMNSKPNDKMDLGDSLSNRTRGKFSLGMKRTLEVLDGDIDLVDESSKKKRYQEKEEFHVGAKQKLELAQREKAKKRRTMEFNIGLRQDSKLLHHGFPFKVKYHNTIAQIRRKKFDVGVEQSIELLDGGVSLTEICSNKQRQDGSKDLNVGEKLGVKLLHGGFGSKDVCFNKKQHKGSKKELNAKLKQHVGLLDDGFASTDKCSNIKPLKERKEITVGVNATMEPLDVDFGLLDGHSKTKPCGAPRRRILSSCHESEMIAQADRSYLKFLAHVWENEGGLLTYETDNLILEYGKDIKVPMETKANQDITPDTNLTAYKLAESQMDKGDSDSVEIIESNVKVNYNQMLKKKLRKVLLQPFDKEEYKEKKKAAKMRKPLEKTRITRGRVVAYATKEECPSYLDLHPDLRAILKRALHKSAKDRKRALALLRCLFFFYENVSHPGSFIPWRSPPSWLHTIICSCKDNS